MGKQTCSRVIHYEVVMGREETYECLLLIPNMLNALVQDRSRRSGDSAVRSAKA